MQMNTHVDVKTGTSNEIMWQLYSDQHSDYNCYCWPRFCLSMYVSKYIYIYKIPMHIHTCKYTEQICVYVYIKTHVQKVKVKEKE